MRLECRQATLPLKPHPSSLTPHFQHECEDSNPVGRLWRPSALPGAHSCEQPPVWDQRLRNDYLSSETFQYASLMNFDQLSMRTLADAYNGFHPGRTGRERSRMPA